MHVIPMGRRREYVRASSYHGHIYKNKLKLHYRCYTVSYLFVRWTIATMSFYPVNPIDLTSDKLVLPNEQEENGIQLQEMMRDLVVKGALPQLDPAHFLSKDVPIYRIEGSLDRLVVSCREGNASAFLAHGELIGRFYESNSLKLLTDVSFVGEFEGMFEWPTGSDYYVFFEGKIHNMQLLTRQEEVFPDEDVRLAALYESSFHGYFKGHFLSWSTVGGLDNILSDTLVFRESAEVDHKRGSSKSNWDHVAREEVRPINQRTEYLLPVLVRLEIHNFGDINLDKSSAVVNANVFLEVRYNDFVDGLIQQEIKSGRQQLIHLNFNRDYTIKLPLADQENDSEDSDWSIQDKLQDIEFVRDAASKTYRYKILKRFRAEIDNSYGAFFAPFNLSRLKIVVSLAPLELQQSTGKVKVSFACSDTLEFAHDGPYDPFAGLDGLHDGTVPSARQVNRYHKINRHRCGDSGEYIIADNLLTLYPHYKVILLNKSYINQDPLWSLGLRDPLPLFEPPLARSIFTAFHSLKALKEAGEKIEENKFFTFSFLRWNHAIMEIPIYKYIVIDMIKIFVPLTLLTVISLFVFQQENGVGTGSGFTTLAYRLVNIAALAIVYVSLIPIIRSSLPAMPGVTFIEIITYLETLPSLLAIINSMLYYTVTEASWQDTFRIFQDGFFLFGFALSLLNLVAFLLVLIVYKNLPYRCQWKLNHYDPAVIRWRSPHYVNFMESIRLHKARYYHLAEQQ